MRKVAQIQSFDDLPKDKRPPEYMWDNGELLDDWFDKVYGRKEKQPEELTIYIPEHELEG